MALGPGHMASLRHGRILNIQGHTVTTLEASHRKLCILGAHNEFTLRVLHRVPHTGVASWGG